MRTVFLDLDLWNYDAGWWVLLFLAGLLKEKHVKLHVKILLWFSRSNQIQKVPPHVHMDGQTHISNWKQKSPETANERKNKQPGNLVQSLPFLLSCHTQTHQSFDFRATFNSTKLSYTRTEISNTGNTIEQDEPLWFGVPCQAAVLGLAKSAALLWRAPTPVPHFGRRRR